MSDDKPKRPRLEGGVWGSYAGYLADLESALASERAKVARLQTAADANVYYRLAAEAVIEQVRRYRNDPLRMDRDLDAILAKADLSALREHDAKVKADALEEAAEALEGINLPGKPVTANMPVLIWDWLRARAAESRKDI